MNASVLGVLIAWRRPEYTGENRCIPCTVVNSIIAVVLAVALALVVPLDASTSVAVGAGVLAVSLAAIALRGYLVPGTPALTKRYFPDWFLRYFDHHEEMTNVDIDPVEVLQSADAVTECENVDDLCLTDEFRDAWQAQIDRYRDSDASRSDLAGVLEIPERSLEFETHGSAFVAMADGGQRPGDEVGRRRRVGQWESEGAFLADVAGARLLNERVAGWSRLTPQQRGSVLNGLRIFLDACPSCNGTVSFGEETVESCCRSRDVVAVTCEECGSRLFEAEVPATN